MEIGCIERGKGIARRAEEDLVEIPELVEVKKILHHRGRKGSLGDPAVLCG